MIETFLFDMGNVLVHFSHPRMCEQIAGVCGSTSDEIRHLLFDLQWQNEFERGELTESTFRERLENHFQRPIDQPALIHAASDIFTLNTPMVPILKSLRRQGKRLVLLSNTSISHIEFVRREYDILSHFDDMVLSYEVGAMKPQPAIFESALSKILCPPERCFYTDDIPPYIEAARQHGLQAEVFTTAESLVAQLTNRGISID
jgi:HAD superfamily hydrolase (TIGR01509 family)